MRGWSLAVLLAVASGLVAATVGPQTPFDLVSKQTVNYGSKSQFPKSHPQPYPQPQDNAVESAEAGDIHMLLLAGPESNMMSFRVGTLTNPEIRLVKGSRLILTVVNIDDDMQHDFSITAQAPPYGMKLPTNPMTTARLQPYKGKKYSGATMILKATRAGTAYYACTVPGHAKAGMYGKIVVH